MPSVFNVCLAPPPLVLLKEIGGAGVVHRVSCPAGVGVPFKMIAFVRVDGFVVVVVLDERLDALNQGVMLVVALVAQVEDEMNHTGS